MGKRLTGYSGEWSELSMYHQKLLQTWTAKSDWKFNQVLNELQEVYPDLHFIVAK